MPKRLKNFYLRLGETMACIEGIDSGSMAYRELSKEPDAFKWHSSQKEVASVMRTGVIHTHKRGTTIITALPAKYGARFRVTVLQR